MKSRYAFVLKSIKKDLSLMPKFENLTGKTYIVSGASRGIGFNIAKKLVQNGANVTIVGKTQTPPSQIGRNYLFCLGRIRKYFKQ